MQGADVVHVRVDVGVGRVEGGLRPHGRVPVWGDSDEGDVGEGRTASQPRGPAETVRERDRKKEGERERHRDRKKEGERERAGHCD